VSPELIRRLFPLLYPLLFIGIIFSAAFAQAERGAIPVVNYPSSGEYRADRDAWGSVRSLSGLMYFANSEGVLQYNGVEWKLIRLPHRTAVQSIAIDRDGRILVGSDSEIGILRETRNSTRYTSLTHLVPESLRAFSQVWTTDTLNGYSYFQASSAIFVVKDDSVMTIPAPVQFGMTYRIGSRLLAQEKSRGLVELRGTAAVTLDSSEFFRTRSVTAILPAFRGKHFILTKYNGVFLYDGKKIVPFRSPLNDLLSKNRPYRGTILSTGESAVGVVGLGLVIIDTMGTILSILNKENGLTDNTVTSVLDDHRGNVWLTGYQGISRFRYPAPVTSFTARQGLSGAVKMMVRHNGNVYAATIENLFMLSVPDDQSTRSVAGTGTHSSFSVLNDVREDCSFLLSVDDDLLASTSQGVFVVNGMKSRLVTHSYALPLLRSQRDPNRVFIGTFGLGSMVRKNGRWIDEGLYRGITEDIYQVIEQQSDVLWLRTYNLGILRVTLAGGASREVKKIERYGIAEGLPSLSFLPASIVEGRFIVPTENGIYCFDEKSLRFVPDSSFQRTFPGMPKGVYAIDSGKKNSYWVLLEQESGYRPMLWEKTTDGTYRSSPLPFLLPPSSRVEWVFEDDDGVCWISATGGLFRYDPNQALRSEMQFRSAIDRVRLIGNDSLVNTADSGDVMVRHEENSLRFSFSANSFIDEQQTRYQTLMEGFETHWSPWTTENRKEYTNLDPGKYTFRVRAKNALDVISSEASVIVRISPPWWGTWWFRSFIVLFFLTVGPVIYYRRVSALKRENELQENFSRQLINRQESERKRIAHELHDSISQSLLSIKNRASMAVERPDEHAWMMEQLNVILSSSSGAIQEIKQITHNLRPYLLDRVGLTKALQSLMRSFSESSSVKLIGMVDEIDGKLPQENEIHLYRIIQEGLNNIQKHSGATAATVKIEDAGEQLILTIADNGKGFDAASVKNDASSLGGLGIGGISERVQILQGQFVIDSKPGNGTSIHINIPLNNHHV
jgi:signal transduction histidine kinase/ligand-binding sensor domain-containing protein